MRNNREAIYCIIGAGVSGLTAAKNFRQSGIPFMVYERESDIGGLWNIGIKSSHVYKSTRFITSKALTGFTDFPMPENYPDYPSHYQALDYLKTYAEHYDLHNSIQLNTDIEKLSLSDDKGWDIHLSNDHVIHYDGVVIASGGLSEPIIPHYQGKFVGQVLHSVKYQEPSIFHGKRVLVVGAGHSGCDIAVEAAQNADQTFQSIQRYFYCVPKYFANRPFDQIEELLLRLQLPLSLRRFILRLLWQGASGKFWNLHTDQSYAGLIENLSPIFGEPLIFNSLLPHYVRHGGIIFKPEISAFDGDDVIFIDGTHERIDIIIYATGYQIKMPFINENIPNFVRGTRNLFLGAFHPYYNNAFFAGFISPDSGVWGITDLQCQLISKYILARMNHIKQANKFDRAKSQAIMPISDNGLFEHTLKVEHYKYRHLLNHHIKMLSY